MAIKSDLVIVRGSTYEQDIEATDDQDNPVDLTGWKVQFMVKALLTDPDSAALVNVALTNIPSPTLGLATFIIPAATTATFPVGTYIYAFQVIDASGSVAETDSGQCIIKADVIQGTT